jgi:hypothetical protein
MIYVKSLIAGIAAVVIAAALSLFVLEIYVVFSAPGVAIGESSGLMFLSQDIPYSGFSSRWFLQRVSFGSFAEPGANNPLDSPTHDSYPAVPA